MMPPPTTTTLAPSGKVRFVADDDKGGEFAAGAVVEKLEEQDATLR
jgi:ribosomal protein S11